MEVLDVKKICGGRKITKNNETKVAKKANNVMFLKQIMRNWTKNVTCQTFYTVFSNIFELNNEIITTVDTNVTTKPWQIEE